ncbi:MAG: replicative helicase loader/inhibitor [Erysipelotrichaceae bacterium]|nr:replicative helicase loader/inhibitor [Erysipelotrichaceae bacterium]
MTIDDTKNILHLLMIHYPQSFKNMTLGFSKEMTLAWHRQFKEYDADEVLCAVDRIVSTDTREYVPNVAQIKQEISRIRLANSGCLSEMDAWNMVRKAAQNSRYNAMEEYEKLSELTKRALGTVGELRAMADFDTNDMSYAKNNFIKSYRSVVNSEIIRMSNQYSFPSRDDVRFLSDLNELDDNKKGFIPLDK